MKKICFVDYDMSITGGAEQVTATLANSLCDEYEVHVCSLVKKNEKLAYEFNTDIRYIQLLEKEERLRFMLKNSFSLFKKYVEEQKIDVVIMMGNYPAFLVSPVRIATKAKYVYCDHGALINQWHQKDVTFIRYIDSLFSHKVITLTERTKSDYLHRFHLRKNKVQCIYNWIEDELLQARKPYEVEQRKILSVGRFGKEKGYDMLVEMAEKVLPVNKSWEWHLYGEGETFEQIQKEVKERGLDNQLQLKGNVKNVHQLFHQYAFLVLPSYREGLPLVLLEAKALGIPMISFDIATGPKEIIEEEISGYLSEPYDIEKIVSKIQILIDNPDLRLKMSEGTRNNLDKFSKRRILKQWKNLIDLL